MKYCSKCGRKLLDEAVICPGCGCKADSSSRTANSQGQRVYTQQAPINQVPVNNGQYIPKSAKTSRTFGILAILLLFPLGIPAIVYANKSKEETGGEFCGPAKAGFICGILALCLWGFGILTLILQ